LLEGSYWRTQTMRHMGISEVDVICHGSRPKCSYALRYSHCESRAKR
jgi:hypothetical protein